MCNEAVFALWAKKHLFIKKMPKKGVCRIFYHCFPIIKINTFKNCHATEEKILDSCCLVVDIVGKYLSSPVLRWREFDGGWLGPGGHFSVWGFALTYFPSHQVSPWFTKCLYNKHFEGNGRSGILWPIKCPKFQHNRIYKTNEAWYNVFFWFKNINNF